MTGFEDLKATMLRNIFTSYINITDVWTEKFQNHYFLLLHNTLNLQQAH